MTTCDCDLTPGTLRTGNYLPITRTRNRSWLLIVPAAYRDRAYQVPFIVHHTPHTPPHFIPLDHSTLVCADPVTPLQTGGLPT